MVSNFYGTEMEIWAGLGLRLVGNTAKKLWADYEQLLRVVFSCFHGQNFVFKNIVISVLKI